MVSRILSASICGIEAVPIEIEVHAKNAEKPSIIIVGLPDTAVKESAQRVNSALLNSKLKFSRGTNTINLAPANLRKEGPVFDLPIALAMAMAGNNISLEEKCLIIGELALDGSIRPVKGILAMSKMAKDEKYDSMIIPKENLKEASLIRGLKIYGASHILEVWKYITEKETLALAQPPKKSPFLSSISRNSDFSEVKGQKLAKRALEIAISGKHNALLIGPPGTGKSMLAKRLPTILAPMEEEEIIETTNIYSISNLLGSKPCINHPPFRSPHHTISHAGMVGGYQLKPGEITLAQNGILFLDELPEFKRSVLESLRQPLEDKNITLSRASGSIDFPARFILIAAMNPCPCGNLGKRKPICTCAPKQVENYRKRISGPLLDRIDIQIEVPSVEYETLSKIEKKAETSEQIRQRVVATQEFQKTRFHEEKHLGSNADMLSKDIEKYCKIDSTSQKLIQQAMEQLGLSARAYNQIFKIARTIADMEQEEEIQREHILEAISYRILDRSPL